MSSFLTDGLVVVVCRSGCCGDLTSLPKISMGYMRNMVCECKINRKEEQQHGVFNTARCMNDCDVLCKVQIILNFEYP
jgi:hypothetical protein